MATLRRNRGQKGIAIYILAPSLVAVVGFVGLAVDVGTMYMIKARLSAAVDAAALAGGRSVNFANTTGQAQTNFTSTVSNFFTANFPTGYFNSLGTPTVTPVFSEETDSNGNPDGVLDFKVTAAVSAPTYFMGVFGIHSITVASTGTASRRGLVLMLVLDQSASMGNGAGSACVTMVSAAQNFLTMFSPYDQIGLITFDYTAHLMDAPTTSRAQVSTDIGNITCGNNTNTISALELAYQQIKNTGLPLALNTIVLFTDGSPNGVTANFPARTLLDTRWGPALSSPAPPSQSGSHYNGITDSCSDGAGIADNTGSTTTQSNAACINPPVMCTNAGDTLFGTITQTTNQDPSGADTNGLFPPTSDRNNNPTSPLVSIGASCTGTSALPSANVRQFIAYIPSTDYYGNNLQNGVVATGSSTYGTVSGGYDTRAGWLFQVNGECSPNPNVNPNCKNVGDLWSNHTTIGTVSNFFPSTATTPVVVQYPNQLRPDQPNTIVAASMNGTMSEAYRIRSDATYHPVIHTIYLTGNGQDSVDREFLAIVANTPQITALPYDSASYTPYANPAYQTTQETGKYLVTSDKNSLANLFAQLASDVLRLSH